MRILFVTGSYPNIKCGVGDYSKQLVEAMASKDYEITVLTSIEANENSNVNYLFIRNEVSKWTGLSIIREVLKQSRHFDIIHFQFPTVKYNTKDLGWVLLPAILRLFGKKIVYTLHEYYEPYYRLPAIVFSNEIIVVENSYKTHINQQYHGLFKDKIDTIKIASNIPKSKSDIDEILKLRANILDATKGSHIISYFGFININKRIELIIEAMHQLKTIGELKSTFLIIGDYYAVNKELLDYQNNIKKMIIDNGLENYIYITGYVENEMVGDYFRSSDAAILLFDQGVSTKNGSFLAAQQEGIDVYTTVPKEDIKFSTNVHLINNEVNDVINSIQEIQKKSYIVSNCDLQYESEWEEVANQHLHVYSKLI